MSFLAQYAHAESSSPSLRGKFIRERILCQHVPTPPANVNTAIPEPGPEAVTLRDRLMVHMQDPSCAGCHAVIDPIGFALESFDGVGRYRILDNGGEIDPSGALDDVEVMGLKELAIAVSEHPEFPRCLVQKAYAYARSHFIPNTDDPQVEVLHTRFAANGYRVQELIRDIALSPGFRMVGDVE